MPGLSTDDPDLPSRSPSPGGDSSRTATVTVTAYAGSNNRLRDTVGRTQFLCRGQISLTKIDEKGIRNVPMMKKQESSSSDDGVCTFHADIPDRLNLVNSNGMDGSNRMNKKFLSTPNIDEAEVKIKRMNVHVENFLSSFTEDVQDILNSIELCEQLKSQDVGSSDENSRIRNLLKLSIFGALDRFHQILDLIPNGPTAYEKEHAIEVSPQHAFLKELATSEELISSSSSRTAKISDESMDRRQVLALNRSLFGYR
jgi:hypothetical protein